MKRPALITEKMARLASLATHDETPAEEADSARRALAKLVATAARLAEEEGAKVHTGAEEAKRQAAWHDRMRREEKARQAKAGVGFMSADDLEAARVKATQPGGFAHATAQEIEDIEGILDGIEEGMGYEPVDPYSRRGRRR